VTIDDAVTNDNWDIWRNGDEADGIKAQWSTGVINISRWVSYNNSDDGFDAWDSSAVVTLSDFFVFAEGRGSAGNGAGIKLRGRATARRGVIANIKGIGVDRATNSSDLSQNSNKTLDNITLWNCGQVAIFFGTGRDNIIRNVIEGASAGFPGNYDGVNVSASVTNSSNRPIPAKIAHVPVSGDFVSTSNPSISGFNTYAAMMASGFFRLTSGSPLRTAGTDIGNGRGTIIGGRN
jgi:hypothetical protein